MLQERTYRLHDLHLRTNLPLGPSPLSDAAPDVVISYVEAAVPGARPSATFSTTWRSTPNGGTLTYEGTSGDRLDLSLHDAGARVELRCTVPQHAEAVARILLGPGMAALLSMRGAVVLHGGAVAVDGRAILILGNSGAGKSTFVAAMVAAGAAFLTEEVAALADGADGFEVLPGYPRIGLSRASIAAVASPADRPLVLPASREDKRWLDVSELKGGLHGRSLPVGAAYVLGDRTNANEPAIARLAPAPAVPTVLQHLYGARWLTIDRARSLRVIAALTGDVPVFALALPAGLGHIGSAAAAVMAHARALTRP